MEHPFWRKSQCKNNYCHRFEIKKEYENGVLEVCDICGQKEFFKIIGGKINNYDYMSYHFHNALPPFHPMYNHEYYYNPLIEQIISPYGN